jgi:hypothetical protein
MFETEAFYSALTQKSLKALALEHLPPHSIMMLKKPQPEPGWGF